MYKVINEFTTNNVMSLKIVPLRSHAIIESSCQLIETVLEGYNCQHFQLVDHNPEGL